MTPASGRATTTRCRRVRAIHVSKMQSSASIASGTRRGLEMIRLFNRRGNAILRAVVVTIMLADWPAVSELWLSEQVVAWAGDVQETATCPVNPFTALTVITLEKVAVWPALTVCAGPTATFSNR